MKILKKELAIKGWSAEELAQKIGMTPPTIHNLINGDSKPRHSTTKKLIDLGFSETAALNPSKEIAV